MQKTARSARRALQLIAACLSVASCGIYGAFKRRIRFKIKPNACLLGLCLQGVIATAALGQGARLDLGKYTLSFAEEFNDLSVSARGPDTKWTAHTPWNGDFGDAQFVDPSPGFPFTVTDGILRIEARKNAEGKWQSGLLSSADASNHGFMQQYGYFEMRAKLPEGPGLWPAFWLNSPTPKGSSDPGVEIDVIEHYGKFPGAYESWVHVWPADKQQHERGVKHAQNVPPGALYSEFHTYGVSVDPDWIIIYFDRVETWRTPTPPEHKNKFMVLVNLAMGPGWPIDQTPNPSYMYVDYIRAYTAKKP